MEGIKVKTPSEITQPLIFQPSTCSIRLGKFFHLHLCHIFSIETFQESACPLDNQIPFQSKIDWIIHVIYFGLGPNLFGHLKKTAAFPTDNS